MLNLQTRIHIRSMLCWRAITPWPSANVTSRVWSSTMNSKWAVAFETESAKWRAGEFNNLNMYSEAQFVFSKVKLFLKPFLPELNFWVQLEREEYISMQAALHHLLKLFRSNPAMRYGEAARRALWYRYSWILAHILYPRRVEQKIYSSCRGRLTFFKFYLFFSTYLEISWSVIFVENKRACVWCVLL